MEQNKEYDKVNVASNDVSFENYNDIWLLIKIRYQFAELQLSL